MFLDIAKCVPGVQNFPSLAVIKAAENTAIFIKHTFLLTSFYEYIPNPLSNHLTHNCIVKVIYEH